MSGKQGDIIRDPPTNQKVGVRKANSRDFHQTAESECQDAVEGSASSETREETTDNSLRVLYVGALTILGSFAYTGWKSKMVINLD
jgi:hypothetical protein